MSTCSQCGGAVVWKQIAAPQARTSRWQCFEPDGVTVHWDRCSQRRWQQVKATGERFERPDESGYARSVHGTKHDMRAAPAKRGKQYRPTGQCRDCVPPWEPCMGCPDAFEVTL